MLGVLSLVPHTAGLYESLPLLLVPQTGRRFAALMGLQYLAAVVSYLVLSPGNFGGMMDTGWAYLLILVYLPCLWMVLKGTTKPTPSATG